MNVNVAPAATPCSGLQRRPAFVYRHVISFEETNVVGNVYFTRHIAWQGRCREMFLKTNATAVLDEIARDFRLVTLRVSCEYFEELYALDEINVEMSVAHLRQHRIGLDFNVVKLGNSGNQCAARGFQEIACMRVTKIGLVPTQAPSSLANALAPFTLNRFDKSATSP